MNNTKILIADYETDIVSMLARFFGKGYTVLTAVDGSEVLKQAEEHLGIILPHSLFDGAY